MPLSKRTAKLLSGPNHMGLQEEVTELMNKGYNIESVVGTAVLPPSGFGHVEYMFVMVKHERDPSSIALLKGEFAAFKHGEEATG